MNNNAEHDSRSPTAEDPARDSTATSVFLSAAGALDEWSNQSAELKAVAVRYFHTRFLHAMGGAATTGISFPRQWFTKVEKNKERLDFPAFLRLFPNLQRLAHGSAQACWKAFQPGDIHACLRALSMRCTSPHEFIFDWFSTSTSFGMLKRKDILSKKDVKALVDALGPRDEIPHESMSLDDFKVFFTTAALAPLLSIFDIFPSPYDEMTLIQACPPTAATTDGFMVSANWFSHWTAYTTHKVITRPPSVYNLDLMDAQGQLKPTLQHHVDYEVVSTASWTALMELYGGGPAISYSPNAGATWTLHVYLAERDGRPSVQHRLVHVRPPVPMDDLVLSLGKLFDVDAAASTMRLWHRAASDLDWTLWRDEIYDGPLLPQVLLEQQTPNAEWPRTLYKATRDFRPLKIGDAVDAYDCERVWRCGIVQRVSTLETHRVCIHFTGFSSIYDEWIHQDSGKIQPRGSRTNPAKYSSHWNHHSLVQLNPGFLGAVGLLNLGNTCFLNCALQCLSATAIWRPYFLQKLFAKDINRHNKLGTKGKTVHAFAAILGSIWSPKNTCTTVVTPHDFRKVFSKCKPQFDGFDQHDGHEYIASLLDAIHEDLNQPHVVTSTSPSSSSATHDGPAAHAAWHAHVNRNQSIVVDVFHGLLRSQTTCNDCAHRRVQFEPCLFLSLPIAQLNVRTVLRVWMHRLDAAPQLCEIALRSTEGNAKMVLDALAIQTNIRPDRLRLIHVQNHRFARLLPVDTLICDFETAILCCFERKYNSAHSIVDIQVLHRDATTQQPLGLPFVLSLDSDATCVDLLNYLDVQLRYYLTFPSAAYVVRAMHLQEVGNAVGTAIPTTDAALLSHFMPPQVLVVEWASDEYIRQNDGIQRMLTPPSRPVVTLEMCLENFMKKEEIADDCWKCEACHAAHGGSRQMDIWKAPDVVMVHLKRFHYSTVQHNKVQELVHFPLDGLNLRPYIGAPVDDPNACLYDLYAVVNHTGGLSEGHYTAYTRYDLPSPKTTLHPGVLPPSHVWLNFDDEIVAEIPPQNVATNAAYVLFYRRRAALSSTTILRVI
ncbi:Aste57867_20981 [Aphanomyces stellatus]|uniref:ubiquitinyl hydrolase 1 n=1 Tax=Aphanomyces stellatus TaxID=120398 RepID=A0A485LGC2_9STRA|nr:hypothetical protein As57867_020913 [Aphanomyces stellatus]VFT97656.1 Aste57867_20981 [Aphanomyces stellatus]